MTYKIVLLLGLGLFLFPNVNIAQTPTMGSAKEYVLFTSVGAITNTSISQITGNVGSNVGAATGFGNVNGVMQSQNTATATCSSDVASLYNQLDAATATIFPSATLGGDTLMAGIYSVTGASTLTNTLTLNAQGNPNSVFIFKLQGAFSARADAKVVLLNGALACNVFWKIEGVTSIGTGVTMRGTIVTNNAAITISAGDTIEGRVFTTAGGISVTNTLAYIPLGCGSTVLTGPAAPSLGTTANFALFTTTGALGNTGTSSISGDVGSNSATPTGFNPALVTGTVHSTPNSFTSACASDLATVYSYLSSLSADIELLYPAQFGNKLVLTPHVYLLNAATTFTDSLFLNAQGNPNAIFVIKLYGAPTTSTFSNVVLINGTQSKNVFWVVNGAVTIAANSIFRGTIICNNGAISFDVNCTLDGRALTTSGAVGVNTLNAIAPNAPINYYSQTSGDPAMLSNWNSAMDGTGTAPTNLTTRTSYIVQNTHTLTSTGALAFGTTNSILEIQNGGRVIASSGNPIRFANSSILQLQVGSEFSSNTTDTLQVVNLIGGKISIGTGTTLCLNGNVTTSAGVISGSSSSNLTIGAAVGSLLFDQSTPGTSNVIHTLTIGGGTDASISLGNDLLINPTGKLSFSALGTKTLTTTGHTLTLQSSPLGSAMIDNTNGATLIGIIRVENYVQANGRKYRFLASPIVGGNSLQWRNNGTNESGQGIAITGTGTVDASISNQASAFTYLETNTNEGTTINGSGKWPAIDGNTSLINGNGYRVFIRGDRTISLVTSNSVNNATTIWVEGSYPSSPVSPSLTYTTAAANGWNLVGNPYPCTLDWGAVTGGDRINIDNAIYIWHPINTTNALGGYASYVNGIGTGTPNVGTQYISSGQAFFVKANASSPTLSMRESHKISSEAGGRIFKSAPLKPNSIRLTLFDANKKLDDAVMYFEEGATNNFDPEFDAYDLTSYIGFSSQNKLDTFAISGTSLPLENETYALYANLGSGNYALQFSDLNSFSTLPELYFRDKFLNKNILLTDKGFYAFTVDSNSQNTFGNTRFELQFKYKALGENELDRTQNKLMVYPNPASEVLNLVIQDNIQALCVFDASGKIIIKLPGNTNKMDCSHLTSGLYVIEVETKQGNFYCKFIK
ncbi:MAG: hypothetical protein CFE21_08200 [Bacteroidetes bacterium B1(2017)]|nr:MAG: hypothetical protein CFE21_08200 [Bacteroidetes bacterium B1(2017)]